jgi:hypothetical protein
MFTGGLKECEMSRVKLQGVCPTAMARILHFMYTGQIRVTEVTVCQLLPAATMFQVSSCCSRLFVIFLDSFKLNLVGIKTHRCNGLILSFSS